jgi:hypothetical protein
MVPENTFIQIFISALESIFCTLMLIMIVSQKMMLLATQTSCLKDSHKNYQINVGIGITYFWGRWQFVCKTAGTQAREEAIHKELVAQYEIFKGVKQGLKDIIQEAVEADCLLEIKDKDLVF